MHYTPTVNFQISVFFLQAIQCHFIYQKLLWIFNKFIIYAICAVLTSPPSSGPCSSDSYLETLWKCIMIRFVVFLKAQGNSNSSAGQLQVSNIAGQKLYHVHSLTADMQQISVIFFTPTTYTAGSVSHELIHTYFWHWECHDVRAKA